MAVATKSASLVKNVHHVKNARRAKPVSHAKKHRLLPVKNAHRARLAKSVLLVPHAKSANHAVKNAYANCASLWMQPQLQPQSLRLKASALPAHLAKNANLVLHAKNAHHAPNRL